MATSFTEKEIRYIKSQRLARIGTASKGGEPDVAAVGFDFDGKYFYVGGHFLKGTRKYRNVVENPQASLVIDDLESVDPWKPRLIKVRGPTDLVEHTGYLGPGKYIRIKPEHKMTVNINEPFKMPKR